MARYNYLHLGVAVLLTLSAGCSDDVKTLADLSGNKDAAAENKAADGGLQSKNDGGTTPSSDAGSFGKDAGTTTKDAGFAELELANGKQCAPYQAQLFSPTLTEPSTWRASGLPKGLSIEQIDGQNYLLGQPTESGTFTIQLQAQGANQTSYQKTHTLVIAQETRPLWAVFDLETHPGESSPSTLSALDLCRSGDQEITNLGTKWTLHSRFIATQKKNKFAAMIWELNQTVKPLIFTQQGGRLISRPFHGEVSRAAFDLSWVDPEGSQLLVLAGTGIRHSSLLLFSTNNLAAHVGKQTIGESGASGVRYSLSNNESHFGVAVSLGTQTSLTLREIQTGEIREGPEVIFEDLGGRAFLYRWTTAPLGLLIMAYISPRVRQQNVVWVGAEAPYPQVSLNDLLPEGWRATIAFPDKDNYLRISASNRNDDSEAYYLAELTPQGPANAVALHPLLSQGQKIVQYKNPRYPNLDNLHWFLIEDTQGEQTIYRNYFTEVMASQRPLTRPIPELNVLELSPESAVELSSAGKLYFQDPTSGRLGIFDFRTRSFEYLNLPSGAEITGLSLLDAAQKYLGIKLKHNGQEDYLVADLNKPIPSLSQSLRQWIPGIGELENLALSLSEDGQFFVLRAEGGQLQRKVVYIFRPNHHQGKQATVYGPYPTANSLSPVFLSRP